MTSSHGQATAIRKAAILLSSLDRHSADALLEKMGGEQAARVRHAMLDLGRIPADEQERIIQEFISAGNPPWDENAGIELDDSLAQKLATPGGYVPEPAPPADEAPPFRFLHEATADALARHLAHEHPQLIAVVVAHLPSRRAADLLARFAPHLQASVLRRVAELDSAPADVIRDVERELEMLLADEIRAQRNRSAGLAAVNSILTAAGGSRSELLANLASHDRPLAEMIESAAGGDPRPRSTTLHAPPPREAAATARAAPQHDPPAPPTPPAPPAPRDDVPELGQAEQAAEPAAAAERGVAAPAPVDFESLVDVDDHGLAVLLREADPEVALLALAGASPALVDRIIAPLPPREARWLRRSMEQLGPLRLGDIEQAQQQLARLAEQLAERGQLRLPATRRFAVAA